MQRHRQRLAQEGKLPGEEAAGEAAAGAAGSSGRQEATAFQDSEQSFEASLCFSADDSWHCGAVFPAA